MSDDITTTLELTETTYVPIARAAKLLGLPAAYLNRLTDDGQLPYLEPLPHKRFYCLRDVETALSRLAHANMPPAPAETLIDWVEFSARAAKALKWLKVETWGQLRTLPKEQILGAPNVGLGTLREIQKKLAAHDAQMTLWQENQEEEAPLAITHPPEIVDAPAVYDGDQS